MKILQGEFSGKLALHIGGIDARNDPALTVFPPAKISSWASEDRFVGTGPLRGAFSPQDLAYRNTVSRKDGKVLFLFGGRKYLLKGGVADSKEFSFEIYRLDDMLQSAPVFQKR